MLRYKEQWKRLGEILHPGDYKKRFPNSFKSFKIIRNNLKFTTFASSVEIALVNGDIKAAVNFLKDRPGDFARRLDHLLRVHNRSTTVINAFEKIADKVSSPVLLQVMNHFSNRTKQKDLRVFFPKGSIAKLKAIENNLPKLSDEVCKFITFICEEALKGQFKKLGKLGKVYVDEELKQFNVPFAMRSFSRAMKTVARGSRIKLPAANTIRFFIWWKNIKEDRVDIDLSAIGLNDNFGHEIDIAYYNLREIGSYHSGDITSAPKGASEFIDINVKKCLEYGVRYIVMCVNSYTEQSFCELPECFAGIMLRKSNKSGEIYEPKTVLNKFDLTADTKICIPLIIDMKSLEMIWTDLALKNHPNYNNNVFNNQSTLALMAKSMVEMNKPTLYDLFNLHAKARGRKTKDKKIADTVFSLKTGITPFDTEKIISEFL